MYAGKEKKEAKPRSKEGNQSNACKESTRVRRVTSR